MISAYHIFKERHEQLFIPMANEEMGTVASDLLENYLNNQLIWQELKHFRDTGLVLAKHPAFHVFDTLNNLRNKSIPELIRREKTLANAVLRLKKLIRENKQAHLLLERERTLDKKVKEWNEVKKLLNL